MLVVVVVVVVCHDEDECAAMALVWRVVNALRATIEARFEFLDPLLFGGD